MMWTFRNSFQLILCDFFQFKPFWNSKESPYQQKTVYHMRMRPGVRTSQNEEEGSLLFQTPKESLRAIDTLDEGKDSLHKDVHDQHWTFKCAMLLCISFICFGSYFSYDSVSALERFIKEVSHLVYSHRREFKSPTFSLDCYLLYILSPASSLSSQLDISLIKFLSKWCSYHRLGTARVVSYSLFWSSSELESLHQHLMSTAFDWCSLAAFCLGISDLRFAHFRLGAEPSYGTHSFNEMICSGAK